MRRIGSDADIREGLAALTGACPHLARVHALTGNPPLRKRPKGFEGLSRVVVGQQLSIASAEAIWGRFEAAYPACAAEAIAATTDDALRATGLSAAKIRTLRAISAACLDGLDLASLAKTPAEEAHGRLTAIKGIGPWTADIYLLFCLGHPDIFPAGDLALRNAVADALGLEPPLSVDAVEEIARKWTPWRGVAAALFWSYYRARRNKAAVPV